jgi:ferredoxin
MKKKTGIFFCRCSANVITTEKLDELADGLKKYDADVFELQDLCALTVNEKDVLNFKELSSAEIFSKIETGYQIPNGEARYQVQTTDLDVPAWFPVIDESRCNLCGKCARFCLFGVYTYNKKSLQVVDPLACKNKCPACGRTCPTQAIRFPRLDENTVLAGAEPGEKKVTIDKGSLLTTLNQRNQNRRNIFRQGVVQQAEEERRKAIKEFKLGVDNKKEE